MKMVETMLRKEKQELERVVESVKKRLHTAPKGNLRIQKRGRNVEYYYKSEKDAPGSNGRYLRKSEIKLAKGIAQRDYEKSLLMLAESRIDVIDKFLKCYEKTSLTIPYEKLSIQRRSMISAMKLPDDEYISQWQKVEYAGRPFEDGAAEIITERGERVRSKSEKIIADKLYRMQIPYRYEYPITVAGGIVIYPDFTILKMPEREEVYLEHFGRMDDSEYVSNTMYKLNTYEKNGIFLGKKLFFTHETGRSPLNVRALDAMLKSLFGEN